MTCAVIRGRGNVIECRDDVRRVHDVGIPRCVVTYLCVLTSTSGGCLCEFHLRRGEIDEIDDTWEFAVCVALHVTVEHTESHQYVTRACSSRG